VSGFVLRDNQVTALANLERDWAAGLLRLGVSSATGTGKTVIMAHLAHRYESVRVLIIVHREELLQQTVDKIRRTDRTLSVGRVKANLNEAGARIVVASIQTISRARRLAQLGQFGLIIVDEAHRSMANQYLTVFEHYRGVRMAGFSATWTRADNRGLGDVWQKLSFEYGIGEAVANGDLVRPRGIYIETTIDLDRVKVTAGDYNDKSVGTQLDDESVLKAIIKGWEDHAIDRQGVIFAPTVKSGEMFREGFTAAGYPAEGLYGITNRTDSAAVRERYRRGQTQLLVSCTRLSEGWDAPNCSAGVIARPTLHEGLFIQMIGRLLRLCEQCQRVCEHKRDAIILDPMGSLYRHDLNGVIDLSESPPPRDNDSNSGDDEEEELGDVELSEDFAGSTGRVVGYEEVDLLTAHSRLVWLATRAGIQFIEANKWIVFLAPAPVHGLARVGWCAAGNRSQGGWLHVDVPTEQAVRLAERAVREIGVRAARRDSANRDRPPTARQRAFAASRGVSAYGCHTQGELNDQINVAVASATLDGVAW
jgi:superfamily II DNA or RNA helicase